MKHESASAAGQTPSTCENAFCPLNRVKAGVAVRIKKLCASPNVAGRLRELGFCENQVVRLLTAQTNIICLVCNARLALSPQVAQSILVEPLALGNLHFSELAYS